MNELTARDIYAKAMSASRPLSTQEEKDSFERLNGLEDELIRILPSHPASRRSIAAVISSTALRGVPKKVVEELRSIAETAGQPLSGDRLLQLARTSDEVRSAIPRIVRLIQKERIGPNQSARRWKENLLASWKRLVEARNLFACSNLKLVAMIAFKHRNQAKFMSVSDLIQEGNIGLMRAIEKFDSRRGNKFSTYAMWWIKQGVRRSIEEQDRPIRVPCHLQEAARKISTLSSKHMTTSNAELGEDEAASRLGIVVEKARAAISVRNIKVVPIDGPDPEFSLTDILPDPSAPDPHLEMARKQDKAAVEELLRALSPKERDIIRMRFAFSSREELSLMEVGTKFDLSRERIRQIEAIAIKKMRAHAARLGL